MRITNFLFESTRVRTTDTSNPQEGSKIRRIYLNNESPNIDDRYTIMNPSYYIAIRIFTKSASFAEGYLSRKSSEMAYRVPQLRQAVTPSTLTSILRSRDHCSTPSSSMTQQLCVRHLSEFLLFLLTFTSRTIVGSTELICRNLLAHNLRGELVASVLWNEIWCLISVHICIAYCASESVEPQCYWMVKGWRQGAGSS